MSRASTRDANAAPTENRDIRVLYVDDEPGLCTVASELLELESDRITATTAPSAEAALDLLDREPFDCVVSDHQMPGMDGLELLDHVRTRHGPLPFLLFTARGSEEIASRAISEGVTDYLQKRDSPDQFAVLAHRIERTVEEARTKAALEESERMFSTLLSNIPGMVYRCLNDRDWTMTFVSEGTHALTGYTPDELESGAVSFGEDVIHPDDQEQVWANVQAGVDADAPFELSYRIVTKDGEVRWVNEQGRGVYEGDTLLALEGVISDVTPLKAQEGAVRERERELERQNKRLERFASVVSHDLRNPLVVAQGSLELARTSGDLDDFERAAAALGRMDALIEDLLTLARGGQRVGETESVVLAPLVTAAWQTIPSDGATLDLSLDEYRIDADERRLRQLFENLLANAVDHGGPGVTVHVGVLDDGTGFFVADDGPGIPPVAREEVFEYGYSTSDGHPGFGLAIVRSIAEAHGWTVSATESAAGGAQFDVGVSQTGQSSEAGQSPA